MKKISLIIVMLAVCIALSAVLAGCGDKNEGGSAAATEAVQSNENAATGTAEQDAAATEAASGLVGSWEYEMGGFTYTFNENGTGSYDAFGSVMNFTYTDNGTSVDLLYEGMDAPSTYQYTIDGTTLTIKDDLGEDVKYIKKN